MLFSLSRDRRLAILSGLFIMALVAANLLGGKITDLFGVRTSVGIFMIPVIFLVTDAVAEVYGKKRAQDLVVSGFIANLALLFLIWLSVRVHDNELYSHGDEYRVIFSQTMRMTVASLVAFLVAQFHDIWAFEFWKAKTGGKFLWLRNNASTFVSQFIDTTLFMFIAFYMVTPAFDVAKIFSLIVPYWLLKLLFAVLDTPFVYLGVRFLKSDKKYGNGTVE